MVKRFLDLGGKSNNKNCFFGSGKALSFESVCKEIEQYNPWDSVIIFGGEPTARNYFFKVLSRISSKGIKRISLITNARAFSYSGFTSKLMGLKGLHVFVELLAPTQAEHDKITGTKNSFKQTINGIKNLQEKSINFSVIVPVLNENKILLENIGKFAKVYDIGNVVLANVQCDMSDELPSLAREYPLLFKTKGVNPLKLPSYVDICQEIEDLCSLELDKNHMWRIIRALERFHEKSLIYVSPDEVYYLLNQLSIENNFLDFAHYVGYPLPVLVYLFEELRKEEIVSIEKEKINLKIGLNKIKEAIGYKGFRLDEDPRICQLRVEEKSLLQRADFIAKQCPAGGRIAVLGDDDFFSLILASKNIFDEIFVFELDERICKRIKQVADKEGYNLQVIRHDLRKKFTPEYVGKFDCFYSDSPYSVNGFSLFFSRGLQLLKKDRKKSGFMSLSPNLPIETVEIGVQRVINDSGVYINHKNMPANNEMPERIKEKYAGFNYLKEKLENYTEINENDSWFLSSLGREELLFHFLTTTITRPIIPGNFDDEIYYGENPLAYYTDRESIHDAKSRNDLFKY